MRKFYSCELCESSGGRINFYPTVHYNTRNVHVRIDKTHKLSRGPIRIILLCALKCRFTVCDKIWKKGTFRVNAFFLPLFKLSFQGLKSFHRQLGLLSIQQASCSQQWAAKVRKNTAILECNCKCAHPPMLEVGVARNSLWARQDDGRIFMAKV